MENRLPKTVTEDLSYRLTGQLAQIEEQWRGQEIGIGFEINEKTGEVVLVFGPGENDPRNVKIICDVRSVFVGAGEKN